MMESSPVASAPVPPPRLIAEGLIGGGGFAVVHRCRETLPDGQTRTIALKCLAERHLADQAVVTAFWDEAVLGMVLDHPHIVRTYGITTWDGCPAIQMEYIHGVPLKRLVAYLSATGRRLTTAEATWLTASLLEALDYAWCAPGPSGKPLNVVHRDLKPGNLLLSADGLLKVLDFGIARSVLRRQTTETGIVKGTVRYLSPEQARGQRELSAASDQFTCGAILYELLELCCLFDAAEPMGCLLDITAANVEEKLEALRPDAADLEPILRRMLARHPEGRFPSAAAARGALLEVLPALPGAGSEVDGLAALVRAILAPGQPCPERKRSEAGAGRSLSPGQTTALLSSGDFELEVLEASARGAAHRGPSPSGNDGADSEEVPVDAADLEALSLFRRLEAAADAREDRASQEGPGLVDGGPPRAPTPAAPSGQADPGGELSPHLPTRHPVVPAAAYSNRNSAIWMGSALILLSLSVMLLFQGVKLRRPAAPGDSSGVARMQGVPVSEPTAAEAGDGGEETSGTSDGARSRSSGVSAHPWNERGSGNFTAPTQPTPGGEHRGSKSGERRLHAKLPQKKPEPSFKARPAGATAVRSPSEVPKTEPPQPHEPVLPPPPLEPVRVAREGFGEVCVSSWPFFEELWVDELFRGDRPTQLKLAAGAHRVRVRSSTHGERIFTIQVEPDSIRTYHLDLAPNRLTARDGGCR